MMGIFAIAGAAAHSQAVTLDAARRSARAENKVASVSGRMHILEANLAKALLICETLWEFIREHHSLTDEQLRKKIYEIDMRDGTLDGKHQRKAVKCPSCSHMVSSRHPACLYCGQIIDDSIFTVG